MTRLSYKVALIEVLLYANVWGVRGQVDAGLLRKARYLECKAGLRPSAGCQPPEPFTQLERKLVVCLCPNDFDHAFDNMVREGILDHPMVELVHTNRSSEADYHFWISDRESYRDYDCPAPDPKKTIVLDETDGPGEITRPGDWEHTGDDKERAYHYLCGFKRSFVRKDSTHYQQQFLGYIISPGKQHITFPLQYSVLKTFFANDLPQWDDRRLNISTVVRTWNQADNPHSIYAGRQLVEDYLKEYIETHDTGATHVGEVSQGQRGQAERKYFGILRNSKILLTANPSWWEGDHRVGEGMIAGAMVMVDHMWCPRPYPLIGDHHVVYFDVSDKDEFMSKIDYYRKNDVAARIIAANGLYHARRYMTAVTNMDYFLITAEKLDGRGENYMRTGPEILHDIDHMYDFYQKDLYPFRRLDAAQ